MGCEDLYDIVASEKTTLSAFSETTMAIDAPFWFQRYYHAVVTDRFPQEVRIVNDNQDISQSLSLLVSLPDLLRNNIIPIIFFDPMNRNPHPKAGIEVPYLEHAPTSEAEKQFSFLQRPTELLLKHLDVPYCEAPLYAEADASKYAEKERVDVVVSNDYDTLLYGAPITIRKQVYSNSWMKVNLKETLKRNDLTYRELLDVAILAGTDEAKGPYKGHIEEAIMKIKKANDLDEFESVHNDMLRGPSLQVNDDSPTFDELHELYRHPPTSWKETVLSHPEPDLTATADFLHRAFSLERETVEELLTPIKSSLRE